MSRSRIDLDDFITQLKGQHVAVLGVGISNRPLIYKLYYWGAIVTAFDALPADDKVLSQTMQFFENEGIDIKWSVGADYLKVLKEDTYSYIFRTPNMRPDVAELTQARMLGSIITSEMELFMQLCPAQIFGVTGSDGKTTTTTLIAEMLKQEGYTVHLGGNIGMPLLDQIESIHKDDKVVLELSSFQLFTMSQSPNVSVVTNISPNHLDYHVDYQEYIHAKRNIFAHQGIFDHLIVNAENLITSLFQDEHKGRLSVFSSSEMPAFSASNSKLTAQVFICEGAIHYHFKDVNHKILEIGDIALIGKHNLENILAAVAAVYSFVKVDSIIKVAKSFTGVEHRIEPVQTINDITFYNSSIDTSPNRSIQTLNALFDSGLSGVLISGGKDKKCDYTGLGSAISRVCNRVVLFGDNIKKIEDIIRQECIDTNVIIEIAKDYEDAINRAYKLARPGEIVIFSPAGTSFDHFRHFEERGRFFKEIVMNLDE